MVLIGGVAHTVDLNMIPEAVSKKLEPMLIFERDTHQNPQPDGWFWVENEQVGGSAKPEELASVFFVEAASTK